jgi:hypothetical protein
MALYKAKKAVKHRLQAQGLKLTHYSAKDIIILAEQYMAQHLEQLINEATASVATWPEFRALMEERHSSHRQAGRLQNDPSASSAGLHPQEPMAH